MKTRMVKANWLSIIPLVSCSLLIACNSGNAPLSSSINDTNIQSGSPSNDFVSNLPTNCVTDNMKNLESATVELCVYTSSSQNSQTFSVTPPQFAKYASFYLVGGSGGGGGGGGGGWLVGGINGLSGISGTVYEYLNLNLSANPIGSVVVGGGGTGGGGGGGRDWPHAGYAGVSGNYGLQSEILASNQSLIAAVPGGSGGGCGYGGDASGADNCGSNNPPSTDLVNNIPAMDNSFNPLPYNNFPVGTWGVGGGSGGPGANGTQGNSGFVIAIFTKNQFQNQYINELPTQSSQSFAVSLNTVNNYSSESQSTSSYIIGAVKFKNGQQIPFARFVKTIGFPGSAMGFTPNAMPLLLETNEETNFTNPDLFDNGNCSNITFEYKPVLQWQPFAQEHQYTVNGVGGNPVSFSYQYASTVMTADCRYDPSNLSKYTTTSTIAVPNGSCLFTNGNLSCNSSYAGYNNGGLGFQLPNGNWVNQCHGSSYDGVKLTANCKLGQNYIQTSANSQPGAYNGSSSCEMSGRSLQCNTSDSYPSGTYGSYAPNWWNWSDQGNGTAKDIFLEVKGEYMTSFSIAAGGNSGSCSIVKGANGAGLLSCTPYQLPGGGWVNQTISALYDGYYLIVVDSNNQVHKKLVAIGSSCEYDATAADGIECN